MGRVLLMMVAYALVFPLQAKLRQDEQLARIGVTTQQQRDDAQFKAQIMFQMVTVGVTFTLGLTCVAILSSVLLNRASRRATLRQINASLLEISNQLKELRQTSASPAAGTKPGPGAAPPALTSRHARIVRKKNPRHFLALTQAAPKTCVTKQPQTNMRIMRAATNSLLASRWSRLER